jgi:hypothetical protein
LLPLLKLIFQINEIPHVDLGPPYKLDIPQLDLIFDFECLSPLSPFSDDQDDSDQTSPSSSHPYFPTFESLTSLLNFNGSDSDSDNQCTTDSAPNIFNISSFSAIDIDLCSSISDGQSSCSSFIDDAQVNTSNVSFPTGDVVFDIFLQDLQRNIPGDASFDFDAVCLKEMDARLLLAPGEVFDDICWAEISQPYQNEWLKPLPDVPFGLIDDDSSMAEAWHDVWLTIRWPLRSTHHFTPGHARRHSVTLGGSCTLLAAHCRFSTEITSRYQASFCYERVIVACCDCNITMTSSIILHASDPVLWDGAILIAGRIYGGI